MKTIFDAVNELKGDLINSLNFCDELFLKHQPNYNRYVCTDSKVNSKEHAYVCTTKEFNALVEEMSTNFGKCAYSDLYIDGVKTTLEPVERCWEIDSDKVADVFKKADALDKKVNNTYTQEMADNGVFPSVGMECLINFPDIDDVWYEYTIDFMGNYTFIASCEDVSERFGYVDDVHFKPIKPLTPPLPLIDGKAYQFELGGSIRVGFYVLARDSFMDRTVSGNKICGKGEPTNIQPLTLAGE